jgi:hypothetical protein
MKQVELEMWTLKYQFDSLMRQLMTCNDSTKRKELQESMASVTRKLDKLNKEN